MAIGNVIQQHLIVLFILFKHWFYGLVNLIRGGAPLKDLTSEIVLITGAASGLGKGVAERLAHLGCTLVLWDVDEVNNIRVAEELNQATKSKRIHAMKCDLTKRESIYECAKKVNIICDTGIDLHWNHLGSRKCG
jgi:NAD(P)-dependent dehydrogenase (short-subunit alcohol dehydrogenase family)